MRLFATPDTNKGQYIQHGLDPGLRNLPNRFRNLLTGYHVVITRQLLADRTRNISKISGLDPELNLYTLGMWSYLINAIVKNATSSTSKKEIVGIPVCFCLNPELGKRSFRFRRAILYLQALSAITLLGYDKGTNQVKREI